jgi:basic membrane protein A
MLLPRTVEADGWTRSGYKGLLLMQSELGASIAYTESVPEADFEKLFRAYAAKGCDFVIGHGGQFVPAAKKVATEYPNTSFAITGLYGGNNSNLGALSMREDEMGYLFGVIAAIKTKTKRVAWLGGAENPSNSPIVASFTRGAQATDPSVRVEAEWVGGFTDEAKARRLAQGLIDAGTDIILVLAGAAGTQVHAQAEKAGIHTLGWVEDQSPLAPKAVITSNVQDIPQMLLRGATLVKQGRWEGKQYRFGMAEGIQWLAPLTSIVTAEEGRRINSVRNDLMTGKIDATR